MLYIMRHGRTDWNDKKKLQGRTDIPLNENGRQMAKNAKEEYKDISFDICFCSPLSRARETAEILLEGRDIPIVPREELVEMSFGEYEGVENSYGDSDCPINVLFRAPEKFTSIGGSESLEELMARTGGFIDEVVEPLLAEGKDVLIVGHGAMNSSIVCKIKGLERKDFWSAGIPNCKLMKLK